MDRSLQQFYDRWNDCFIQLYLNITFDTKNNIIIIKPRHNQPHPYIYEILTKIKHDIDINLYPDLYIVDMFHRDNLFSIAVSSQQ